MIKKQLKIRNKTGLHARPAAMFADTADRFEADVDLTFEGVTVNGKSIIGVLSLGIGAEDTITLTIDGPDEQAAMEAMVKILENSFGENG